MTHNTNLESFIKMQPNQPPSQKIVISFAMPKDQVPSPNGVEEEEDYASKEDYDEGGEDEIMEDNNPGSPPQILQCTSPGYSGEASQHILPEVAETSYEIQTEPAIAIKLPFVKPTEPFTISLSRAQPAAILPTPIMISSAPFTLPIQSVSSAITIPIEVPAQKPKIQAKAPPQIQQITQSAHPVMEVQAPFSPFYQQPSQFTPYPQTPLPQMTGQIPPQRPASLKQTIPLTKVYNVVDRQVNIKIDPEKLMFKAQMIYELQLEEAFVDQLIQQWHEQGIQKVQIDLRVLSKHYQIVQAYEIDAKTTEKLKQFTFNVELLNPNVQAKRHYDLYPAVVQLNELEDKERKQFTTELTEGNIQIRKKLISLKPRKMNADELRAKFKNKIRILIEYFCEQISQGSTLRYVSYKSDETEANRRYLYTNDLESHCWLPLIVGSEQMPSTFTVKYIVPKEYMVIASGVQKARVVDKQGDCLHTYELDRLTTPDKIGFICCLVPHITTITSSKCSNGVYACFLSQRKQSFFNHQVVTEVVDYLAGLLQQTNHACSQIQLVFVPNLFVKKFPKQVLSFGGGLHILDQEILFRPNQVDKRHHLYKHIAGALTFDYFGYSVREQTSGDAWLLESVRQRIGDRFKKKKCGSLLYRYQIMRSIEKLYEKMKNGAEMFPLQRRYKDSMQSLGPAHPSHQYLSDIFYRKCSLLMHMIESNIDESHLDKIFREMFIEAQENNNLLSQMIFRKKFKKICGMQPLTYYQNWIWATGCPKLELSYEFNKRNNSLDLTLKQTSTTVKSATERFNLSQKLEKIFSISPEQRKSELSTPLDTFYIEERQAARRFFIGEINLVIYQVEGGGGDIKPQQHKMTLKEFKSVVNTQISLQGKVKRTMQNRKKDFDTLYQAQGENEQKKDLIQNDVKKFEMNEFELEDFPLETKNIFLGRELDNNPVLWIRVDPDMEFIRKVSIVQDKRNNWLFQLLRENDIIGQIEAARRLHVYNEDLVYGILKTVAGSENYFYKVRREVLKSLNKMEIFAFSQYISHEMFLLKLFNQNRLITGTTIANSTQEMQFYKENDFSNILEYFMDRGLLKAISLCKEQRLILLPEKQREVEKILQRSKIVQDDHSEVDVTEPVNSNAITLTLVDNHMKQAHKQKSQNKLYDDRQFKTTTGTVAQMLLRVLEQNDNSENCLDDSFYLKDLIAALGRLDNVQIMPEIAKEIYRQFKLDQISNSSPQFAITLGCIKAYFNMRKQIFKFKTEKLPYINFQDPKVIAIGYEDKIERSLDQLEVMKVDIDKILVDSMAPLQIRHFIFHCEFKNLMLYKSEPFCKCLGQCLRIIYNLQCQGQLMFAFNCLRDLCMFLEDQKLSGNISLIDVYLPRTTILQQVWQLYTLPHCYLSHEFSYWAKRLLQRLYNGNIPGVLQNLQFLPSYDPMWVQNETDLMQNQNLAKIQQVQMDGAQQQQHQPNHTQQRLSPINLKESTQIAINIKIGNTTQSTLQPVTTKPQEKPVLVQPSFVKQDHRDRGISFNNQGQFKIQICGAALPDQAMSQEGNDNSMMEENFEDGEREESEYDPFAQETFPDPTMQKCWLILGDLFYHYEATDFLEPITEEKLGQEMFDDYCSVVKTPMDISTIMERIRSDYYLENSNRFQPKELFYHNVMLIFSNCREYNEPHTEIVNSANTLTKLFQSLCKQKNLF